MSSMDSPDTHGLSSNAHTMDPNQSSRKSYRRKYRKIMVTFEEKMREATTLFKEEQRMSDISQRLAEQVDQLMQLLLDLNSYPQVPPRMRYDLQPPRVTPKSAPDAVKVLSLDEGHESLRKARHRLQMGEISSADYRDLEEKILGMPAFQPTKSYNNLLKTTPVPTSHIDMAADSIISLPCGFLTTKQEEIHARGLDDYLNGIIANPRAHALNSLGNPNAEKTIERERELQLRNPVSVYNWLRKHQPQVFLQDNEGGMEKPSKPPASRSSKRAAGGKDPSVKQEPELYDEDGVATENAGPSKGKRKRDDDGGYRPKGGAARATKRKKDEGGSVTKRGKKMSLDTRS